MKELHLVSPNDELSQRNGSAILTVARELAHAAIARGSEASIGGGTGQARKDFPLAVEVQRPPLRGRFMEAADKFSRVVRARPLIHTIVPDVLRVANPTTVYFHNLPWIGGEVGDILPDAQRILYVHNRILRGVPRSTMRRVLGSFSKVVCVSDYIRGDLLSRAGIRESGAADFVAILNGVDASRFSAASKSFAFDVGFFGRFVPEKGLEVLVEAIKLASRRAPLKVLLVGGKGFIPGERSEFEARVLQVLDTSNAEVEATGPIPPERVPGLMQSVRIVVVPSVWPEPCALVALEGLASSGAVIASDVGGLPELAVSGGMVLVPPDNAEKLSDAITDLLVDPERRSFLAKKGQTWAQTRSWPCVYDELRSAVNVGH